MNWHPTNTEAALSLVALIIGGILLIWARLRQKYGKPAERPGDSARLREPFPPLFDPLEASDDPALKVELGQRREEFPPAHNAAPAPPKRKRTKKSLTKTQKNVSAKRTTRVKR